MPLARVIAIPAVLAAGSCQALAQGVSLGTPAGAVSLGVGGITGPGGIAVPSLIGTPNVGAALPGGAPSLGIGTGATLGGAVPATPSLGIGTGGTPGGALPAGTSSLGIGSGGIAGGIPPAAPAPGMTTIAAAPSGGFGASGSGGWELPSIRLPAALMPNDRRGDGRGSAARTLRARPGTPLEVVQNCRQAVAAAAIPYGVVRVDAASAGPMQRRTGSYSAPVEFSVVYARKGGLQTRRAVVSCRLNLAGRVLAAL